MRVALLLIGTLLMTAAQAEVADKFYAVPTLWKVRVALATVFGVAGYYSTRWLLAAAAVVALAGLMALPPAIEPEFRKEVVRVHGPDYELHAELSQALIALAAVVGVAVGWKRRRESAT